MVSLWLQAVEDWGKSLVSQGVPNTTIAMRSGWIKRLGKAVGRSPWLVSSEDLSAWGAANAQWSRNTRRSAYASVRQFYKWAAETGKIKTSPALNLPIVQRPGPRPHPCPETVLANALARADDETRLMILLAADVGLRRGEVACIHAKDVINDLLGFSLIVHGKGDKERIIPLPDDLARTLLARCGGGYAFPGLSSRGFMDPGTVGGKVSRALGAGWSMHSLRHRFASRAYAVTGDLPAVQALLGHASPETTLAYVLVEAARLRRAVEQSRAA